MPKIYVYSEPGPNNTVRSFALDETGREVPLPAAPGATAQAQRRAILAGKEIIRVSRERVAVDPELQGARAKRPRP